MARTIDANFAYTLWQNQIDWVEIKGRSITRWGSPNNYSISSEYNDTDIRLGYSPTSSSVDHLVIAMEMDEIRAIMGYRGIILSALWYFVQAGSPGAATCTMRVNKFLKPYPDIDDVNYQYKDITATTTWYSGGYAPQVGKDISSSNIGSALFDNSIGQGSYYNAIDLTDYIQEQLLNGDDLWLEVYQQDTATLFFMGAPNYVGYEWKLDIAYMFPIEMFPVDGSQQIDLSRLLNIDNQPIDLGAYQRNQTGTGIQYKLKNFSNATINHIEVWDDHPQWSDPVADAGNGGSGDLDYVSVFEACVSQRWEIKFSSSTAFEVKATAYLDNTESLHPSYDADANWQGTTSSDWDSPGGNVTIPTAAWSGTPSTDDLFVFYTRGNTTDNLWPADSNDQVEICGDTAGSPDGDWRPVNGRRTELTAGVTIDSTSKTLTVKRIVTTDWPNGTEVFVADQDNIDEGVISGTTATSVSITFGSATSNVYSPGAIVATTLPIRDLAPSNWAQLDADSGASQTYKDRIYIPNASTEFPTNGVTIFVQSISDPDTNETAIIDTTTDTYVKVTTDLTYDYEPDDFIAQLNHGEASFWLRVVADASTDEELKEFRLNVIS